MNPHRTVARAIERLGADLILDDDGPHAALVLGISHDRPPHLWIVAHSSIDVAFDVDTAGMPNDEDDDEDPKDTRSKVTLSVAELERAAQWLTSFSRLGGLLAERRDRANDDWHWRREREFDRASEAADYELKHPHQCAICGRRFTTPGGRTNHQRQCNRGRTHHAVATQWVPVFAIQCACGEIFTGEGAQSAMTAHVAACEIPNNEGATS